jgi:threonine dehydratase
MEQAPTLDTIRTARQRIAQHIHRTPVMTCAALDRMAGARLYFKCENLQKTGSFKIRGATNAVFSLPDEAARRGVVTHSSGNHAAALARAARERGVPAWIVMPSNAPQAKCRAVEGYGGQITFCEPTIASREATAKQILEKTGAVLVHPYDNADIIAGQGTATLELLEELPDLDAVIAPVSGGGLLSGTAIAAKSLRPQVQVIGAEPANADDAFRSLRAGRVEPLSSAFTMADGLRAGLCERTFEILRAQVDDIVLISEEEIVAAMRHVWERMKLIVEPSSAVAVAVVLKNLPALAGKRIGIIVSGGNVDLERLPFTAAAGGKAAGS